MKLKIHKIIIPTIILMLISACTTMASDSRYLQCVPYARQVSGIEIYGDAHTWWAKAQKKSLARGKKPEKDSVFILSKTKQLPYGHLSVVKKVVSPRLIEVDHANWGKNIIGQGNIYKSMPVKDVSKNNDWSKVRFWSPESENFGYVYPATGFVYNRKAQKQVQLTQNQSE